MGHTKVRCKEPIVEEDGNRTDHGHDSGNKPMAEGDGNLTDHGNDSGENPVEPSPTGNDNDWGASTAEAPADGDSGGW